MNYKYKTTSAKVRKKGIGIKVLILSVAVVCVTIYTYNFIGELVSSISISINNVEIDEEVKNSQDSVIQKLVELSYNNSEIRAILNNIEEYPRELLELASAREEAISFVYEYPKKKDIYKKKKISIKSDYKLGEYPLFIQWDERWGYKKYGDNLIALTGCGPTTLAMAIVGLTGNTNINPKVVADFAYENGYHVDNVGSSWDLMTKGAANFGIIGEELPLSEEAILSTLKKGNPIIATMGPGEFTTSGHFLLLVGVTDEGKIILNDSASKSRSEKTWDIDVFMRETGNLWKLSRAL